MTPEIKNRINQIRRGEVPEEYHKDVKVLPKTWKSYKFSQLGSLKNGLNFSKAESGYQIKVLGVADFQDKSILSRVDDLSFIELSNLPDESQRLKDGDIVFVRSNGSKDLVGRNMLVYPGEHHVAFSGFCIRFRLNQDNLTTAEYINLILDNGALKKKLKRDNRGTNITNLSQDMIGELNIELPSVAEQRKICNLLSKQNRIVELKEKRIAEKQRQKKHLMQQLLVGKKRLAGFNLEWCTHKLGSVFSERAETKCDGLPLLAITGTQGIVPRSELDLKDNSNEDKSKYLRICIGDIGYNTMRMWQGVSAYSDYEGIVSPAYTVLKPADNINAKYFSYLFKMPEIVSLFYRHSQGLVDDTRNLKYANFKKIKVTYPRDRHEQDAIVAVLSSADREIELLRKDLETEKQKKKALMQLLLTGIVRVKV